MQFLQGQSLPAARTITIVAIQATRRVIAIIAPFPEPFLPLAPIPADRYSPTFRAAFRIASSTAFFMLSVSAPWRGGRADAAAKVVPANSMLRRLSRFEPAASGDFSVRMRHVLA